MDGPTQSVAHPNRRPFMKSAVHETWPDVWLSLYSFLFNNDSQKINLSTVLYPWYLYPYSIVTLNPNLLHLVPASKAAKSVWRTAEAANSGNWMFFLGCRPSPVTSVLQANAIEPVLEAMCVCWNECIWHLRTYKFSLVVLWHRCLFFWDH